MPEESREGCVESLGVKGRAGVTLSFQGRGLHPMTQMDLSFSRPLWLLRRLRAHRRLSSLIGRIHLALQARGYPSNRGLALLLRVSLATLLGKGKSGRQCR